MEYICPDNCSVYKSLVIYWEYTPPAPMSLDELYEGWYDEMVQEDERQYWKYLCELAVNGTCEHCKKEILDENM